MGGLTGIKSRRGRLLLLFLAAAAVGAGVGAMAIVPPARADVATSPFVLAQGLGLSDQYGYAPAYTRNVPAFDREGRAYIRSRTSAADATAYIHTLVGGAWQRLDFLAAIRASYPTFVDTVGAAGLRNDSIVFDRQDRAYNPLEIKLRDGTTRNVLLVSWDLCRTWRVFPLPKGTFTVEHWVGHNDIDGPPFLAVWRLSGTPDVPGGQINQLYVTQPRLDGDQLVIPPLVPVSSACVGLSRDSGGASFAVTRGGKTFFVWSDAAPTGGTGTTHYIATYDQATNSVGGVQVLAKTPSKSDPHNKPGICMDTAGYLHVICGGHGSAALYMHSLAPLSADQGWTTPVPVLSTGWVVGTDPSVQIGKQTYPAFVCDSHDTLHLVTRQWRRGVDSYKDSQGYAALVHQSCPAGGTWGQPTVIVAGAYPGYGVFFHKLALDGRDRLFVSSTYQGGPELVDDRSAVATYALLGRPQPLGPGKYRSRMLLVSDDGGSTWRFATDADLAAPGESAPAATPAAPNVQRATAAGTDLAWSWRNPLPQGNQFTGLSFSGGKMGWAVGTHGTVRRTTDGGLTWTVQGTPTTADLFGVAATGPKRAWAVGADGTILVTADGGASWLRQESGVGNALYGIYAASASRAWAVGERGIMLSTIDGGKTWTDHHLTFGVTLFDVAFGNKLRGVACGAKGELLFTEDGGGTWVRRRSGAPGGLFSAAALPDGHALVCGENGLVLASTNGGWSWQPTTTGTKDAYREVRLLKGGKAWALGPDSILLSKDSGKRWTKVALPVPGPCGALALAGKAGLVAGGAGGALLRSADGGKTWRAQGTGVRRTMNAVAVAGKEVWTAGQNGTLARTDLAGKKWTAVRLAGGADLAGLARFGQRGWAVGERGVILATSNGGKRWRRQMTVTGQDLTAVAAPREGAVVIAGMGGTLLTSADYGANWTPNWVIPDDVLCLSFTDASNGWAGGGGPSGATRAELATTTDGGLSWREIDLPVWGRVRGVSFVDGIRGWVAVEDWGVDGDRPEGAIMATTDGGATWLRQAVAPAALLGVRMSPDGSGWAWGELGTVLHTWDGGATWTQLDAGTDSRLSASAAVSANETWFVGGDGAVIAGAAR